VNPGGPATGSLPVSFVCGAPSLSASVAVSATLDGYTDALAAWQETAYDAIVAGYGRQLDAFRAARRERIAATSHDRRRAIEVRELEGAGISILWDRHAGAGLDEPAYRRFFDRAFEWKERAYEFYPWPAGRAPAAPEKRGAWAGELLRDPCSDALFLAFLTARSARVLVPIVPGDDLAVLYYFVFGVLPPWSGGDVPLGRPHVEALCALLSERRRDGRRPEEERWIVEVPTSHLVLEDGCEIPRFER
jgi:hypothetical protein